MIIAYFTEKEKYLQKDNYKKSFNVNSIEELLFNIKTDEDILLKSNKKTILNFILNNKNKKIKTEIIDSTDILDFSKQYDFDRYLCLLVPEQYKKILGEKIHIVETKEEQLYYLMQKDEFAFLPKQLQKMHRDVLNGEISKELAEEIFS